MLPRGGEADTSLGPWKIRRGKPRRPPVPGKPRSHPPHEQRESRLGAPRIHGELLKLSINVGETSVSKYLVRNRKPPSQIWWTFLENHVQSPYVRRLLHHPDYPVSGPLRLPGAGTRASPHPSLRGDCTSHCRVDCTAAPGSFSVGQRAAVLLRDRDRIFGRDFVEQVEGDGYQTGICRHHTRRGSAPMSNESLAPSAANALIT